MEKCKNCHLKFGTSTSLGSHVKKVHPEYTYVRKNLKCTNCDYSAKSQTVINEHYKRCCKTEIQTCDLCEFRASSYNLSKHFKLEHRNSNWSNSKLICTKCDYIATTIGNLDIHMKSSSKDESGKLEECEECNYKSCTPYLLSIHMKKAHEESTAPKLKCKECAYEEFSRYV